MLCRVGAGQAWSAPAIRAQSIDPATFIRESRSIFYSRILEVFFASFRGFLQGLHVLRCCGFQFGFDAYWNLRINRVLQVSVKPLFRI